MVLEYGQLLSNAHELKGNGGFYRKTHLGNRFSKWTCESIENYLWMQQLFLSLSKEYTKRYNKVHKTFREKWCDIQIIPHKIKNKAMTPFVVSDNIPKSITNKNKEIVDIYRDFYHTKSFAKWNFTEKPFWFNDSKFKEYNNFS